MHGNAIARRSTALACALQIFVVVSPSICSPSFTPFLFLFFFFFYPLSFSSLSLSLIYARGIIRATYICLIKSVVRGALLTLRYVKNVNATSRAVEINSPVACFPAESVSRRRERERERERRTINASVQNFSNFTWQDAPPPLFLFRRSSGITSPRTLSVLFRIHIEYMYERGNILACSLLQIAEKKKISLVYRDITLCFLDRVTATA